MTVLKLTWICVFKTDVNKVTLPHINVALNVILWRIVGFCCWNINVDINNSFNKINYLTLSAANLNVQKSKLIKLVESNV